MYECLELVCKWYIDARNCLSMKTFTLASIATLVLLVGSVVEAKSTRSFSGDNPAEVEKNARNAGFEYPDGKMECSARCTQRWGRD